MSAVRSAKCRPMRKRSASCLAISSSRSQAPTISHPLIRWIWEACASAIFPQPTIAILSMTRLIPAAGEVAAHSFRRGHGRLPAQAFLELRIRVARLLPERMPAPRVEDRRQLALRPMRIPLPQEAEDVAEEVRDVDGAETPHVPLVIAEEAPARGQIVVDDVENLTVHAGCHSGQNDRLSAVINVGQGDRIRTTHMQKEAERRNADPIGYLFMTGTVYIARPNDHVRNGELVPILGHDLILLRLPVHVRLAALLRFGFQRARLVKQPAWGFIPVRKDREGADVHDPLETAVRERRLEQVARRDRGVHESVGKHVGSTRREVIDDGHTSRGAHAVLGREEVAHHELDAGGCVMASRGLLEGAYVRGGPHQAPHKPVSVSQQALDHAAADEARSSCHEDEVVRSYDRVHRGESSSLYTTHVAWLTASQEYRWRA